MSHAFSRSMYDTDALKQHGYDSMSVFNRISDSASIQANCYSKETGIMPDTLSSIPGSNVNIESDLRGHNVVLSRYGETRVRNCDDCAVIASTPGCINDTLIPEYSRFDNQLSFFKGIHVNRFNPLCEDYQTEKVIPTNDVYGVNTRLSAKDKFRN